MLRKSVIHMAKILTFALALGIICNGIVYIILSDQNIRPSKLMHNWPCHLHKLTNTIEGLNLRKFTQFVSVINVLTWFSVPVLLLIFLIQQSV